MTTSAGSMPSAAATIDTASRGAALLAGVFLVSLGFLGLQITLTRVLSVGLSHHYVFAVVSLALLGLGLGGVITHVLHARGALRLGGQALLAIYGAGSALAIAAAVVGILVMARIPFFYEQALLYFGVILLPFLAAGLFFAELYRQFPVISGRLYGADLIGAALGSVIGVVLLNIWGGIGGSFLLATIAALGALLLAGNAETRRRTALVLSGAVFAVTALLSVLQTQSGLSADIPLGLNPEKEIHDAIHGPWNGEITETRWGAFGRSDLIAYRDNPDHRDIYIDGTAGTPMYRFTGDFDRPGPAVERLQRAFPGAFPFRFMDREHRDRALVIGPGGGRDVLLAALAGFDSILAVEVNPELIALVESQADFNGGLFTDFPDIRVVHGEGRHFIKRDRTAYDLIMMSLPVTNTSRSREGFALTENFLLTEQAIGDYLDHLTSHGQLVVITHDELAVVRLVRIVLGAMEMRGVGTAEAMEHMYVLGSFPYPVVVVSRQPFERGVGAAMLQQIRQAGYSPAASYVPHVRREGAINPALQALAFGALQADELVQLVAEQGHDVSAVTDNKPFFYHFDHELPRPVSVLFQAALIAGALVLVWPLVSGLPRPRASGGGGRQRLPRHLFLFAAIGLGFMLIEVSLVQQLTLLLGDPVLSLAVLLFSILVFMGLGSLTSGRIGPARLSQGIAAAGLLVALLAVAYAVFLPMLLGWLIPLELAGRIAGAVAITAPLAFLLGLPFPLGIRSLEAAGNGHAIPWMWAVNGVFSVLGAVSAVVVAMVLGLQEVLIIAAACYLVLIMVGLSAKGRLTALNARQP